MKKNALLLLVVPSLFLFSCSRPVIVDEIDVKEAIEFINTKYANTKVVQPSLDTNVTWKINKDNGEEASKHINKYIAGPEIDAPIGEDVSKKASITDIRAAAFYSELENVPTDKKLGDAGYEAVCALRPDIHEALYHGQGEPNNFRLKYKYNGSGAGRGLKITSEYQDPNITHKRVHTYNRYGQETKFEFTYNNGNDLNYTFTINFKYDI